MLARKEKLTQEMKLLLAEFYSSVSTRYVALTRKHRKQRQLALSKLMEEWRRKNQIYPRKGDKLEEQNAQESNTNKLFIEDTSSEAFHSL